MAKDPFLLVSLEESESKALAQVMSNDTARKVLDFLSKHESATESDVAKGLKLALSTVHYNLQALVKANLVQAEEFHYSKKGKEVLHYSLANKVIIIAPKKTSAESFRDKLKGLFAPALVSIGLAGVIELFQRYYLAGFMAAPAPAEEAALMMFNEVAQDSAAGSAPVAAKMAMMAPEAAPVAAQSEHIALWFLAGSMFALLAIAVWQYFSSKKR